MPLPGQIVQADPRSYCTSGGTHGGYPAVDAFANKGTPIWAPYAGRSEPAYYSLGGNACWFYVDASAGAPYKVVYMAHGHVPFKAGRFTQGQQIGQVGDTGNAQGTSPHVHYSGGESTGEISNRNGSGSYWFPAWTWGQGTGIPQPTPTPFPRFKVAVNGLRLRASPGTTEAATVIEELPLGAVVVATAPDSHSWRRVKSPSGKIGWVADDGEFLEAM